MLTLCASGVLSQLSLHGAVACLALPETTTRKPETQAFEKGWLNAHLFENLLTGVPHARFKSFINAGSMNGGIWLDFDLERAFIGVLFLIMKV